MAGSRHTKALAAARDRQTGGMFFSGGVNVPCLIGGGLIRHGLSNSRVVNAGCLIVVANFGTPYFEG